MRLPFSWGSVRFGVGGSSSLRVCITGVFGGDDNGGGLSLVGVDGSGGVVVSVGSLVSRVLPAGALAVSDGVQDSLFSVQWTPLSITGADDAGVNVGGGSVVVLGGGVGVVEGLVGVGVSVSQYPGLAEFESALGDGVPCRVLLCWMCVSMRLLLVLVILWVVCVVCWVVCWVCWLVGLRVCLVSVVWLC